MDNSPFVKKKNSLLKYWMSGLFLIGLDTLKGTFIGCNYQIQKKAGTSVRNSQTAQLPSESCSRNYTPCTTP